MDNRGAAFSIAITDGMNSDVILFPYLLNDLDAPVGIVRADNGYLSRDNVRFVEYTGAVTYIKPKSCSRMRGKGESAWRHNALQVSAGPAVVPEGVPPAETNRGVLLEVQEAVRMPSGAVSGRSGAERSG